MQAFSPQLRADCLCYWPATVLHSVLLSEFLTEGGMELTARSALNLGATPMLPMCLHTRHTRLAPQKAQTALGRDIVRVAWINCARHVTGCVQS